MLSAAECRLRAAAALATARKVTDGAFRRHFEDVAREWTALALTADVQQAIQARLIERLNAYEPHQDGAPGTGSRLGRAGPSP